MAALKFKVELDRGNGPERVVIGVPGIIAWERKTGQKISAAATVGLGLDDLAFMAFETLRRQGVEDLPRKYEEFADQLLDFGESEDDDSDPLDGQRPGAPSSD